MIYFKHSYYNFRYTLGGQTDLNHHSIKIATISPMKYSCLILDHDDTAVDSTAAIHYPAHVEIMRQLRPTEEPVSLEGWFRKNFQPGIMEFLRHELHFSDTEIEKEYQIWREFTAQKTPPFYPGFLEILHEFKDRGGLVAVVSHSEKEIIQQHYNTTTNGFRLIPDLVYGWTTEVEKRKPSPYPVHQILERYQLSPEEVLVVDDLKPGVDMAKAAGVPVAAAGWAHQIPEIKEYMKDQCDVYLESVADFKAYLFNDTTLNT